MTDSTLSFTHLVLIMSVTNRAEMKSFYLLYRQCSAESSPPHTNGFRTVEQIQ